MEPGDQEPGQGQKLEPRDKGKLAREENQEDPASEAASENPCACSLPLLLSHAPWDRAGCRTSRFMSYQACTRVACCDLSHPWTPFADTWP